MLIWVVVVKSMSVIAVQNVTMNVIKFVHLVDVDVSGAAINVINVVIALISGMNAQNVIVDLNRV
ncbi:hypothetical protein [Anaerosinus sp.]|uniref:hypothetical protein n=1 Tax=Selenobaculum sp. TaxID=3074374 RepID=UPI0015AF18DD